MEICLRDAGALGLCATGHGRPAERHESPALDARGAASGGGRPLRRREGLRPEHPAYVIYTSGSGPACPRALPSAMAASATLRSENSVLGVREDDLVYQGFSLAFDMSFEEIWISYLVGAACGLRPNAWSATRTRCPRR